MDRPSSQSKPNHPWHRRIEHYTPDGTLGRLLFGVVSGTFSALLFSLGIIAFNSFGLFWALTSIIAPVVGFAAATLTIFVIWPVYLSLIGNIESPEAYAIGGSSGLLDVIDSDDSIALLKRQYAAGKMDEEEFERRLDTLLEVEEGTSSDSSNPSHDVDLDAQEFDWN